MLLTNANFIFIPLLIDFKHKYGYDFNTVYVDKTRNCDVFSMAYIVNNENYYFILEYGAKSTAAFEARRLTEILARDANKFIDLKTKNLVAFNRAQKWGQYCHIALDYYLNEGKTEEYRQAFNFHLSKMNFKIEMTRVKRLKEMKVRYVLIQSENSIKSDEEKINFMMMAAIDSGEVNKLKKCRNVSCKKFFVGRPNRKWCSDNCGSKIRNKIKRKKDKFKKIF